MGISGVENGVVVAVSWDEIVDDDFSWNTLRPDPHRVETDLIELLLSEGINEVVVLFGD